MPESWKLLELRARISRVDTQIVALLAERLKVAADIQHLKQVLQLPAEDGEREARVLRHVCALGADLGVDPALITCLWQQLFEIAKSGLTVVKEQPAGDGQNSRRCRNGGRREVCDD